MEYLPLAGREQPFKPGRIGPALRLSESCPAAMASAIWS
jgi:hypothetical protein